MGCHANNDEGNEAYMVHLDRGWYYTYIPNTYCGHWREGRILTTHVSFCISQQAVVGLSTIIVL